MEEFLESEDIKSENGELVRDLVKKIGEENPLHIPEEYITYNYTLICLAFLHAKTLLCSHRIPSYSIVIHPATSIWG